MGIRKRVTHRGDGLAFVFAPATCFALGAATCFGLVACADEAPPTPAAPGGLSLVSTLGGLDTAGYERATEIRDFVFPDDHGPHPRFRTEWWYVTGNLDAVDGRAFGFHLTIFRNALAPAAPGGPSAWATNQAYMGHFALTDVESGELRAAELFARGSAGIAGAAIDPLRVWIEDWTIESTGGGPADDSARLDSDGAHRVDSAADPAAASGPAGDARSVFPLRVAADGDDVALDLRLAPGKPLVLQGDRGLSLKGPEPGDASYYYSLTRMPAEGRVVVDGDTAVVSGLGWLDREWSTSALSEGQVGWDWFALQLDDGWDMMVYRLRRDDGSADTRSDGVLVDPEGRRTPLAWGSDVTVTSTGTWRSPLDGTAYPSGWRIEVPARGWDLEVEPVVQDQELRLSFRYWEGAVRVSGTGEGAGGGGAGGGGGGGGGGPRLRRADRVRGGRSLTQSMPRTIATASWISSGTIQCPIG